MREQFLAEARVMARLDHPVLPKVSDYFIVENGREYLVMDYVEGEDLLSLLERTKQPLDEQSVLRWAEQVLDALAYLHTQRPQSIIHRDIKPANLRTNLLGQVKLVDFGLVKLLDRNSPETKLELRGIGTPAYAPLEQFASSDDHTDTRSDIYALGATLYHLLTNFYPPDVHQRMLNPDSLPRPRQLNQMLSENTERVILKAMEVYPNDRYQSAEEMRQALLSAAGPSPGAKQSAAPISAWVFGVMGLIVVLVILAGFSYVLFGGSGQQEEASAQPEVAQEQSTATPTSFILQALADAPTDTPTPVVEQRSITEEPLGEGASPTETPIASPEPTAVTTSTAAASRPRVIPASALVGTIAYPVFNGTDYDLYFGQADGSGSSLYRKSASQPAFSPDGSQIAFHSWRLDAWGLMTMDIDDQTDPRLIANFVEDQLPTWTADGQEIILLSRRAGDRKSRLIRVGSAQERSEGVVIGEGEYPTIGPNNRLFFKGWGSTGSGLRIATTTLTNVQPLTDLNEDTAPAPSPDGQRVAFMSRRDGNWEIYIINVNGTDLQRLTDNPADDGLPTWSPDGRALAFASNRGGPWAVWAMTPSGNDQGQLFVMEGSPDGFVGTDINASRGWTEERISWTR
jgi:serine/threonine protein kinase